MSNYFDNQAKWSWQVSEKTVLVTTDHGSHTHTMDVTNVPMDEMVEHSGKVMGDAHRSVPHDFKEKMDMETDANTMENGMQESGQEMTAEPSENQECIETEEECEDGIEI